MFPSSLRLLRLLCRLTFLNRLLLCQRLCCFRCCRLLPGQFLPCQQPGCRCFLRLLFFPDRLCQGMLLRHGILSCLLWLRCLFLLLGALLGRCALLLLLGWWLMDRGRQTARLRLRYPELSLAQLADKCDPPVSKSCMNHRMRKLTEEAKKR